MSRVPESATQRDACIFASAVTHGDAGRGHVQSAGAEQATGAGGRDYHPTARIRDVEAPQLVADRLEAPELVAVASALLVAAGDNPGRLRHESAFAHLCGTAPIDASSGRRERHRLNRGGDRQANSALWHVVLTRMVCDPRTMEYINRWTNEGLTKEGVRCLKRYVAREVHGLLPRERQRA
jgi:transposase